MHQPQHQVATVEVDQEMGDPQSILLLAMGVLAQAAEKESSGPSGEAIASLLAVLASSGFAIWYGRYVTTVTIPKLVDQFAIESKAARDAFTAEAAKLREAFTTEAKASRDDHRSELHAIRTAHAEDIKMFWLEHKQENLARRTESEKMSGVIQSLADSLAGKSGIIKRP